ncbi:uncharacterized protein L199_007778 [Kwoniella botswanensis]|uniref:uncharacterized protein n=1 Tax=Kwoniella botswanensis TaxID=1268659 RepID=UPI00315CC67D
MSESDSIYQYLLSAYAPLPNDGQQDNSRGRGDVNSPTNTNDRATQTNRKSSGSSNSATCSGSGSRSRKVNNSDYIRKADSYSTRRNVNNYHYVDGKKVFGFVNSAKTTSGTNRPRSRTLPSSSNSTSATADTEHVAEAMVTYHDRGTSMPMQQHGLYTDFNFEGFQTEPQGLHMDRMLSDQGLNMTTTGFDQLSLTSVNHQQDQNNHDWLFPDLADQPGSNPVEIAYEHNVLGYLPSSSSTAGPYTALPEGYYNDITTRNQFQAYSQGFVTSDNHPQAVRSHPPGQFDKRSMMCDITFKYYDPSIPLDNQTGDNTTQTTFINIPGNRGRDMEGEVNSWVNIEVVKRQQQHTRQC